MATVQSSDYFTPVHSNVYKAFDSSIGIDKDTHHKSTRLIPPSSGLSSADTATNHFNGKMVNFLFSANTSNSKLRWDTSGLLVDLRFTSTTNTEAASASTHVSPPWNLWGALVDSLVLKFNDTQVYYQTQNGAYLIDFTTRMLKEYTWEQLNKMDDVLFTPIGDDLYISAEANSANYDPSGFVDSAGAQAHATIGAVPLIAAATSSAKLMRHVKIDDHVFDSTHAGSYNWGDIPNCEKRRLKYIGSASHTKKHHMFIPFSVLFPRMQGCFKNLRKVEISIIFNSSTDLLEKSSSDGAALGHVHVMKCMVVTDDYVLSTGQSLESLDDKVHNETDKVAFYNPFVHNRVWNGTDLLITTRTNVESVMMISPCRTSDRNLVNVDANRTYGSSGQFVLFSAHAPTTTVMTQANAIPVAGCHQINTVQIQLGSQTYPINPINVDGGTQFDASQLLLYHDMACGKVSDRLTGSMIPYRYFAETMPFVHLKLFDNNAAKLSEAQDIIIRTTGGDLAASADAAGNNRIYIVTYELLTYEIGVDGSVATKRDH